MGSQSRHNQAMDAQTRQANALERIADALQRLADRFAPPLNAPNAELHYDNSFDELFNADVPPEDYHDGD